MQSQHTVKPFSFFVVAVGEEKNIYIYIYIYKGEICAPNTRIRDVSYTKNTVDKTIDSSRRNRVNTQVQKLPDA